MKQIIKKKNRQPISLLLTLVLLFAINFTIIAQDRNVIWVHGLNGNETHWAHYETIFNNERQINSVNEKYPTNIGIENARNDVRNDINEELSYTQQRDPKNLGIGHSLGGVVLRDMDRKYSGDDQRIGGLITVNSPNYGAPIINSAQDGSLLSAAQYGANMLTKGPIVQFAMEIISINNDFDSGDITDYFITQELLDDYGAGGQTATDLKPNSSILTDINNYPTGLPIISIWGNENSPVHWRAASSAINYGNTDYALAEDVNSARSIYNGMVITNYSIAAIYTAIGFWNPWFFVMAANSTYAAVQWTKGRNWIDNSETIWCSLIETSKHERQTYWERIWVPCIYPPTHKEPKIVNGIKIIDADCGHWEWRQYTRWVTVNYPSDGVLPQYTQELQNIPNGNRYEIKGANHMEVLDMSNSSNGDITRARFNEIFNRDKPDFFNTKRK